MDTLYKTGEKFEAKNYPYGLSLRTSKFYWVEFKQGKGFREVTQTVNPKTGKLNKPKTSTYSEFLFLAVDNDRATFKGKAFYHDYEYNATIDWIADKWGLMTDKEKEHTFIVANRYLKVTAQAQCTYCGSKWEDIKPIIEAALIPLLEGIKTLDVDKLKESRLDSEALASKKVEGYNPFTIKTYGM